MLVLLVDDPRFENEDEDEDEDEDLCGLPDLGRCAFAIQVHVPNCKGHKQRVSNFA